MLDRESVDCTTRRSQTRSDAAELGEVHAAVEQLGFGARQAREHDAERVDDRLALDRATAAVAGLTEAIRFLDRGLAPPQKVAAFRRAGEVVTETAEDDGVRISARIAADSAPRFAEFVTGGGAR